MIPEKKKNCIREETESQQIAAEQQTHCTS